jgi:hypothetical protein
MCLLPTVERGLLTTQVATGLSDPHALARAQSDEVGLELSDHRQHVEQQPPHRIRGVVNRSAQIEADLAARQLVCDRTSVRQGSRQPAELWSPPTYGQPDTRPGLGVGQDRHGSCQ